MEVVYRIAQDKDIVFFFFQIIFLNFYYTTDFYCCFSLFLIIFIRMRLSVYMWLYHMLLLYKEFLQSNGFEITNKLNKTMKYLNYGVPGWCKSPKGVNNLAEEGVRERLVQVEADSSMVFEMVESSLVALLDSVRFKPFGRGSLIRGFLLLYTPLDCSLCLLDIITCQWFFTALSVLPGNSLAIIAHLLPYILWALKSLSSSSSQKLFLLILGSNWLNHLNLQLFPAIGNPCKFHQIPSIIHSKSQTSETWLKIQTLKRIKSKF